MTLDELIDEEYDLVEKIDGLVFTYRKGIAPYVNGKVIDYHTGVNRGFSVTAAEPGCSCDGCSC